MSMIGRTLGNFECTTLLGKGGMGEVYQAKDRKLGREVAIKVLPEEFARDADRVARFQREAKLLASLNHPNIASIYGLEESEGTHFLVLELIEGDTLADRIKAGPIAVEEALKLAIQVAEALEAAHEKGVIHRDLKPANIKVTTDGKVKVLDFGLAKAYAGEPEDADLSNSPTLSAAATQQGVILGTAAYMSPEQARGKSVDTKADIWAFGCVLFEMLTGRAAFSGGDVTDILAAVIRAEPEWKSLPANLHWRLREVLERCLEKEAKDRYSGISDARVDIQRILADPSGVFVQPAAAAKPRKKLRLALPWVAAVFILGLIIAGVAVWKLKPAEPRQVMRFEHYLPENQQLLIITESPALAISPDGKRIVYSTGEGLYMRTVNDWTAHLVAGTEGPCMEPFFSPDAKWIGYFSPSDQQLKKIAVTGGSSATICDLNGIMGGASWHEDNTIVYSEAGRQIMRVSGNGGIPESVVKPESGGIVLPQILPDGKSLLYMAVTGSTEGYTTMVRSLESGDSKELLAGGWASYLPTGHIVYRTNSGSLAAVPFDLRTLEVTDGSVPIVEGVRQYAVSGEGTLVYIPGAITASSKKNLVWLDREGKEEPLSAPPDDYRYARISPDGTRIALTILSGNNEDIHIWDLVGKSMNQLTFDEAADSFPLWTLDSQRIVFRSTRNDGNGIYVKNADGTGEVELLSDENATPMSLSADGKTLVLGKDGNIGTLSMDGDKTLELLLQKEYQESAPMISTDGKWMTYMSNESSSYGVYVCPFPNVNGGKWRVSTGLGLMPQWSWDGRELFYWSEAGLMAVDVETDSTFKFKTPKVLFQREPFMSESMGSTGISWNNFPGDKKFLVIKPAEASDDVSASGLPRKINIVLNWFEELMERVPVE